MASFYLVASGALGLFAWGLQHGIYHPPPPPGQMYAAVFVRDPATHVRLSADIYPNQPWSDSLTVTVGHPSRGQAGWLLVIECPGSVSQSPAVHLYSEASLQAQSAATLATIDTGIGNPKRTIMFGCFPAPKSPLGISGYSPSLANVSVAALQLDDGMVGAPGLPVLYARQSNPGGAVSQLVQVFPNVSCPSATPTPVPATSTSATTPTSPSAAATSQPSGGSTAPTPQTSSSPSSSLYHRRRHPRRRSQRRLQIPAACTWHQLMTNSSNTKFPPRNRQSRRFIMWTTGITRFQCTLPGIPQPSITARKASYGTRCLPRIPTSARRTLQFS